LCLDARLLPANLLMIHFFRRTVGARHYSLPLEFFFQEERISLSAKLLGCQAGRKVCGAQDHFRMADKCNTGAILQQGQGLGALATEKTIDTWVRAGS
jgi:hypothetical protein